MKLSERLAKAAAEEEAEAEKGRSKSKSTKKATDSKAKKGARKAPGKKPTEAADSPEYSDRALEDLKAAVRTGVVKELGPRLSTGAVDEAELRRRLENHLLLELGSSSVTVGPTERSAFFDEVLDDMLGWGPLEALMEDQTVTEIMCNAHDDVWIERKGVITKAKVRFPNLSSYRSVIDRMLALAGRRVDDASPMADGRLRDGSRVNAIIPPLVVGEPVLTIRRFPEIPFTVEDLVKMESISEEAAEFLEAAVEGKLNVLISGGTGTGKTTLLNVISNYIPEAERVVTIEDAAELRLNQPHVITLEARAANIEGIGEVAIRQLVRNALRMRPDRIVVGEVRGGEALDMLQAMNTGHEGSLTTVHANTARDALSRIETMVLFSGVELPLRAVREQIASALDIVIHLARRQDGAREIQSITEIQGREGDTVTMQDIFTRQAGGPLMGRGLRPKVADKLADAGVPVAPALFRSGKRASQ